MSRIRSIKPEFWSSEQVMECSPIARLLFIGIWNFADDAGRHPLAAKQIKALVFPGDDLTTDDVSRMLDELSTNGLIKPYTVEGKDYFEVTGWHHQKIDRPQKGKYPAPFDEHSTNPRDGRDEGGDRDKGKETEAKASGANAPAAIVPIDAKTALYREGIDVLSAMTGKPQASLKGVVGRWLKLTGDDHSAVLGIIRQAQAKQVIEPIAWVEKSLKPRDPDADIYRAVL